MRLTGACGQHSFDDANSHNAGERPRGKEQFREREGFVQCTERLLHTRIIMTYAVVEA
jgi:hypothetical protein